MSRSYVVAEKGQSATLVDLDESLLAGDIAIDVAYSSVNYKDGMALLGRPGIIRKWPLVPGIDIVGTVTDSADPDFAPGDVVIMNGAGTGEDKHGGLSQRARTNGGSLIKLPPGISALQAAAIGTAGFTAMLGVLAIEDAGIATDAGEVLVTGAAGGVGSVTISLLARRGYGVVASTGRVEEQGAYLTALGASRVIDRGEFSEPGRPLQTQRWAAAMDSVGSHTLVNVLAQTNYGGLVVACGLAQGADLNGTVLPFILRGVTLTGANSVDAPRALRERAWAALAAELDLTQLDSMTEVVPLDAVPPVAAAILEGKVRGRVVVDVNA